MAARFEASLPELVELPKLAVTDRLPDITTAGLLQGPEGRYTDLPDWITLHAPGTVNPTGVPGRQVDGYFPDTSSLNTTHGWGSPAPERLRYWPRPTAA